MATTPKPRTAYTLGVFAKELEAEGFTEDRVTALLVVALTHELRDIGLWVELDAE